MESGRVLKSTTMVTSITQLIYTESGGFAGLQRGCTIAPQALPPEPLGQLQGLVQQVQTQPHTSDPALRMPDMQVYTLELVSQAQAQNPNGPHGSRELNASHWVLQYPASDVPDDVTALIEFLHQQSAPLPPR
jgi:hypothetical protein